MSECVSLCVCVFLRQPVLEETLALLTNWSANTSLQLATLHFCAQFNKQSSLKMSEDTGDREDRFSCASQDNSFNRVRHGIHTQ